MKIFFTIDSFGPGGKERQLSELVKGLYDNSVDCELLVLDDFIYYETAYLNNIKIHKIVRRFKKDPLIFLKLFPIIKEAKADIIHSFDDMSLIYSMPTAKILDIPIISGTIRSAPDNLNIISKENLMKKITFPFVNTIISNSKAGIEIFKAPQSKSRIIHNGVDLNRFTKLEDINKVKKRLKIKTKYSVCMVGRFDKKKDYNTYLESALVILKRRNDISFICVGGGEDLIYYKQLIYNYSDKIKDKIIFTGVVADVESIINLVDLCVLCSFSEGFPNVVMEYMALGKLSVCTRGGGVSELVEHNKTGILIEQQDSKALINNIEYYINNNLSKIIGRNAKNVITNKYSMQKMTYKYLDIYDKIDIASHKNIIN